MKLLSTSMLLSAFEKHLATVEAVDIAVAWAGPSPALDMLRNAAKRGVRVRAAVGLDGNSTSPDALRALQEFADVRIADCGSRLFHSKCYMFHYDRQHTVCWVGSANFTLGGFSLNSELVHEFKDTGYTETWFNEFWSCLEPDADDRISNYIDNWKRPRSTPTLLLPKPSIGHPSELLSDQHPTDWQGYIVALKQCHAYWDNDGGHFSVLADQWSYLDTINTAGNIVRRSDWRQLSKEEVNIVLAYRSDSTSQGAWGLLGSMKGAGRAVGTFLSDASIRQTIRNSLDPVLEAKSEADFIDAAVDTIHAISELRGFGPGIATRLIALARPDRGVSVNKGSSPSLAALTGLPANAGILANAKNYPRLLEWVYRQPWYRVTEPDDSFERTIWSMRAAVIDSFVYVYV